VAHGMSFTVSTSVEVCRKDCQQKTITTASNEVRGPRQTVTSALRSEHWFVLTTRPGSFRKLPRDAHAPATAPEQQPRMDQALGPSPGHRCPFAWRSVI